MKGYGASGVQDTVYQIEDLHKKPIKEDIKTAKTADIFSDDDSSEESDI
jgi:hypothetical protein